MEKAIVVGATSGIGRAVALLLANKGYKVGVTGRRSELLNELKTQNTENFFVKAFDITVTESVSGNLEQLVAELGGLDLLVLCSGIAGENDTLGFSREKEIIQTNVLGFTAVANWAVLFFRRKGSGHLACITSMTGLRGNRFATCYSATKSYQINYLKGLRHKVKKNREPIYVTDICPGFIDTQIVKTTSKFWVASPDIAAIQIFNSIKKRKKKVYITKRWVLMAIVMKVLPDWIYNKV